MTSAAAARDGAGREERTIRHMLGREASKARLK